MNCRTIHPPYQGIIGDMLADLVKKRMFTLYIPSDINKCNAKMSDITSQDISEVQCRYFSITLYQVRNYVYTFTTQMRAKMEGDVLVVGM
jgi:hypothetical protein